jgi:hypothetical protein
MKQITVIQKLFVLGLRGFGYQIKNVNEYLEDTDAVMYGILRGCFEIMEKTQEIGRNYVNIDHGYFTDRGKNTYYRMTRNARSYEYKLFNVPDDRFKKLNITLQEYKTKGQYIVILPPSEYWGNYYGVNPDQWATDVVKTLNQYTDMYYKVKKKDETIPLSVWLKEAALLIHYSSMGGLEALIAGVPVITLGPSFLSKYTTNNLADFNKVIYTEREKLFNNLAYNQFTPEELSNGTARDILNHIYQEIDRK